ncbi:MAG: Sjogren's syndrome/scleroderma autoantigen 1 family protein [Candidatus Hodarchaeota archaeon]
MERKKHDTSPNDFKQMSALLLSGATMLADSCPDCNVPLFKKKERIFCPKCDRNAIYAKSDNEIKQIEHSQSILETRTILQDIFTGKIHFLAQRLASSEELDEIQRIVELLDKIMNLLLKMKEIP